MANRLKRWFYSFLHLFFPPQCVVCGAPLQEGESALCLKCNMDLPRTYYHLRPDNPVEQRFWGKFTPERATSYFFYQKGSDFRRLLHLLKYEDRPDLGISMGRLMAVELRGYGFFDDIDLLVPIPLHPRKERMRGYNQSQRLAEGIAQITGLPIVDKAIIRNKFTDSQTHKSAIERWENVEGIFQLVRPELLQGRHILLIDDVLTTGSTIIACTDALKEVKGLRISILTLAVAN